MDRLEAKFSRILVVEIALIVDFLISFQLGGILWDEVFSILYKFLQWNHYIPTSYREPYLKYISLCVIGIELLNRDEFAGNF